MKCIICGNVEFKLLHKGTRDKEDIDVYSCLHCGGGQLSTFSHIYDGFYENSEMWEDVNVPAFEEKMAWKDDMRRVQLVLGDMGGFNKWICDFGCGYGGFLDLITPYVPKAVGVELEQKARQKMQSRGLRVEESLTMYDEKFDIITSFQVIEHLISPHEYINQISAKLNRNGKIIIETPNIDDALIKKYYCKSFQDFTFWSNHVFLYSMNSLEKLLEDCGLSLVWKKYIQRYPVSNHLYWLSQSLPGGHEKFNELNSCIIEKEYERLLANDGACDTLLVCAEKVM